MSRAGCASLRIQAPLRSALLALAAALALAACGGGGSGGTGGTGTTTPTSTNFADITIDAGPAVLPQGTVNLPFVTVTVCIPNTATCQSIDHVLLDTGSTGLRLIGSVLQSSLVLPQARTSAGDPMFECMSFADGYSWGSVNRADVKLGDGTASNIPVHVIAPPNPPAVPNVPADCPNGSPSENTVEAFGANGVIGLNVFREDCGANCTTSTAPYGSGMYYGCPASGCVGVTVPLTAQVPNPVWYFGSNNNGIAVQLPAVDPAGQLSATGKLLLGIDTQADNMLGSHTLLTVDSSFGLFSTTYKGSSLPYSFIDSGSNGYFFADGSLPACTQNSGFYCPTTLQALSATNTGLNNATSTVAFSVANADSLTSAHATFSVFPNVAGSNSLARSFDWGLPFFYGRTVFVGFELRSASSGSGPFVAY